MALVSRVSEKGQVTLPKRSAMLRIRTGDGSVRARGGAIRLRKRPDRDRLAELYGSLKLPAPVDGWLTDAGWDPRPVSRDRLNVILDVLGADRCSPGSLRALGDAQEIGLSWRVTSCGRKSARTTRSGSGRGCLDGLGIRFAAMDQVAAAAVKSVGHRRRGGARERILADFLIGTHAWMRADRFLTRDRGFYREYFKRLSIVDPWAR
jgi:predicted nucleic acid-binding protein